MNATISGTSVASDGTRHSLSFPLFFGGDRRSQARDPTCTVGSGCSCVIFCSQALGSRRPVDSMLMMCKVSVSASRLVLVRALRHVRGDAHASYYSWPRVPLRAVQGQWADEDTLPSALQGQYTPDQLQLLCLSQVHLFTPRHPDRMQAREVS